MRGSCHLGKSSNVEIGVEYQIIVAGVFFNVVVKCIFGHLQDLERFGNFMAEQLVLLFNPAKQKKVNKHFKIRRQFQNSTACPNVMIQALKYGIFKKLFL